MTRLFHRGGFLALLPFGLLVLASATPSAQPPVDLVVHHEKEALPLLKQYCLSCHAGTQPSGGVSLDPADVSGIHKNAENWRKGLVRLKDRSMPPQGSARLSQGQRDVLIADLTLVRRHLEGIVAWAQTRQTNGFLEAINGLFQAAKRRARGFKRLSTIKTVIFLIAGKLDFHAINPHARQPT